MNRRTRDSGVLGVIGLAVLMMKPRPARPAATWRAISASSSVSHSPPICRGRNW
jgi:hypothetical protein